MKPFVDDSASTTIGEPTAEHGANAFTRLSHPAMGKRSTTSNTTISDELVACLICGKGWRSLGHHVRQGHGISADEYRDRFGIRRSQSLTSPMVRARFAASIAATIAAGKLDYHYAGNAARASAGAVKGAAVIRQLRARGIDPSPGAPHLPRETIGTVVKAVEAGAKVATAVKRAGIAYSAYHVGLARFPDMKARHDTARKK